MSCLVGLLVKLTLGSFIPFPQTLEKIFVQIASTNLCDLVMSIIIMVVVFIVKELNERYKAKLPVPIPIEVIVVSVAIVFSINMCACAVGFKRLNSFHFVHRLS